MDLSVIIVNWNTKEFLLPCVRSALESAQGISSEVIVVDNGSRDGSGEEVKKKFPFIHLIENKKNLGFAKAANQGLEKASGGYLLLLNPDTQVKGSAIERLVSFMESHPEAGVAGGQLLNADASRQNSIANFPSLATELLNKSLLRWLFPKRFPGKERGYLKPIEVDSVIGACMVVRWDTLDQVGLLDEDYFIYGDEADLQYRLHKKGWKVYFLPSVNTIHYGGRSMDRWRRRKMVYRGKMLFYKKNYGPLRTGILRMMLFILSFVKMLVWGSAFVFPHWRDRAQNELDSNLEVIKLCWNLK